MKKIFYLLAITTLLGSCKKNNTLSKNNASPDAAIEFYLLESYTLEDLKCKVNPSGAILKAVPFVKNEDILAYSESAYTYTLSSAAMQRIKALAGRQPFAITVDGEVVFYGFYNPIVLSSSCDHSISMDADSGAADNKVLLRLGYPGLGSGIVIDDQRNDARLINVLKAQEKWSM